MADDANAEQTAGRAVLVISAPRLPYHEVIEERYGVNKSKWKALVEAVYPNAKTVDSVLLVLSYCQSRNLDPFKRPVHIVPVWDSAQGKMVDTVWPGISETRTTAMRTKQYAGCDETEFGPDIEEEFTWDDKAKKTHSVTLTYPEWARMTVYRLINGARVPVVGPRCYWKETYAPLSRFDTAPNEMWRKRPRGQIEKCAEAAALRRAFPEELGDDPTADEMEGQVIHGAMPGGPPPVLEDAFGAGKTAGALPKREPPRAEGEPPQPAPNAAPDNPTSDSATPASGGSAAGTSSQQQPDEQSSDGFPGDRTHQPTPREMGANPPIDVTAFNGFLAKIQAADSWLVMKPVLAQFQETEAFKAAPDRYKTRALRLVTRRAADLNDPVQPASDCAFYRLWLLDRAPGDGPLIRTTFKALMKTPEYRKWAADPDLSGQITEETNRAVGE